MNLRPASMPMGASRSAVGSHHLPAFSTRRRPVLPQDVRAIFKRSQRLIGALVDAPTTARRRSVSGLLYLSCPGPTGTVAPYSATVRNPRNPFRGTALLRIIYLVGPSGEDCSAQPNKPFTIPAIPKPDHVCQGVIVASQANAPALRSLRFGVCLGDDGHCNGRDDRRDLTNQVRGG
jgi:hypothetical protein